MILNTQQINSAILAGNFSHEELKGFSTSINHAWSHFQRLQTLDWRVGDRVSFQGRRGSTINGKITKVNQKSISVTAEDCISKWNVSPSLLTKITKEAV